MKCRLCNITYSNTERSHSRNPRHISLLKKQMKIKKNNSITKYGWFKYDPSEDNQVYSDLQSHERS